VQRGDLSAWACSGVVMQEHGLAMRGIFLRWVASFKGQSCSNQQKVCTNKAVDVKREGLDLC